MLSDWLNKLLKNGDGPAPDEAEREIARYRTLLNDIAKKLPGSDAAKHQKVVDNWTDLANRLRGLLAPSDGKRRFAVRGIHLENATQQQRPLLLFLTELGTVQRPVGRGGMVTKKQWSLVDWTDPSHARFRGHYEGEGTTVLEAVNACFGSWDWGNSYPAGHVQFEVPVELRPAGRRRRAPEDGHQRHEPDPRGDHRLPVDRHRHDADRRVLFHLRGGPDADVAGDGDVDAGQHGGLRVQHPATLARWPVRLEGRRDRRPDHRGKPGRRGGLGARRARHAAGQGIAEARFHLHRRARRN